MLGGVPISVVRPPSNAPNASGISNRDGAVPVRRARSMMTGRSRAATPTLFRKADIMPAVNMITAIMRSSLLPASLNT